MKNPYADRLRALREERGKNFTELARVIGVSRQAVANWERSDANSPSMKNLMALADFYGMPLSELTNVRQVAANLRLHSEVTIRQDNPPLDEPLNADVPLIGVAVGGAEGDFAFNGERVSLVPRPPGLKHARGIFAVHIASDSMAPRFQPGELVYVSSLVVPVPGDDIIIEMQPDAGASEVPAFIKRLIRRTATAWVCEQFNPQTEVVFPHARVARVHKVLTLKELFGA